MSHRPLHPPWKLDKDGKPLLDRDGNKIRSPKAGTPKKPSEYTPEERVSIERQHRNYEMRERLWARAQMLDVISAAQTIKERSAGVK